MDMPQQNPQQDALLNAVDNRFQQLVAEAAALKLQADNAKTATKRNYYQKKIKQLQSEAIKLVVASHQYRDKVTEV